MSSSANSNSLPITDPSLATSKPSSMISGLRDISEALRKYHLIGTLGWQDVATRYRRSRVGAFWITINVCVMFAALGLVFSTLLGQPIREFLPFLAVGLVVWGFISSNLNEGCTAFADASGIILQVKMPLWIHVGRVMWKNIIIFGHNIAILPFIFLVFWRPVGLVALLAIPGFLLLILNLLWMMTALAVICARFRDLIQMMSNAVQVLFYLTPVFWTPEIITQRVGSLVLYANPFYSLLTIVRAPLLGEVPSAWNWAIAGGMAMAGWLATLLLYGSRLRRVPYWL